MHSATGRLRSAALDGENGPLVFELDPFDLITRLGECISLLAVRMVTQRVDVDPELAFEHEIELLSERRPGLTRAVKMNYTVTEPIRSIPSVSFSIN